MEDEEEKKEKEVFINAELCNFFCDDK